LANVYYIDFISNTRTKRIDMEVQSLIDELAYITDSMHAEDSMPLRLIASAMESLVQDNSALIARVHALEHKIKELETTNDDLTLTVTHMSRGIVDLAQGSGTINGRELAPMRTGRPSRSYFWVRSQEAFR